MSVRAGGEHEVQYDVHIAQTAEILRCCYPLTRETLATQNVSKRHASHAKPLHKWGETKRKQER